MESKLLTILVARLRNNWSEYLALRQLLSVWRLIYHFFEKRKPFYCILYMRDNWLVVHQSSISYFSINNNNNCVNDRQMSEICLCLQACSCQKIVMTQSIVDLSKVNTNSQCNSSRNRSVCNFKHASCWMNSEFANENDSFSNVWIVVQFLCYGIKNIMCCRRCLEFKWPLRAGNTVLLFLVGNCALKEWHLELFTNCKLMYI